MKPMLISFTVACMTFCGFSCSIIVGQSLQPVSHRCAVRVTADRVQQSLSQSVSTAVVVKYEGNFFLVTAYHSIHNSSNLMLKSKKFSDSVLNMIEKEGLIEENVYVDLLADLVVFRFSETGAKLFADAVPNSERVLPVELFSRSDDSTIGLAGIAVGNPDVYGMRPLNIVYSCTVSEVASVANRISQYVSDKSEVEHLHKKAKAEEFLFLETLSVAQGFSGGPVLVDNLRVPRSEDQHSQSLVGIVLGGDPTFQSGRFAFSCRPSHIKQGFNVFLGMKTVSQQDGQTFRKFAELRSDWLAPVYKHGYGSGVRKLIERPNPLRRRIVKNADWQELIRTIRREQNESPHSVEFLFDGVVFENVDFRNSDLTNATFLDCKFQGTKFEQCILNGVTFKDCSFFVAEIPQESDVPKIDLSLPPYGYGRPLMAYGVHMSGCYLTDNPEYGAGSGKNCQINSWSPNTKNNDDEWERMISDSSENKVTEIEEGNRVRLNHFPFSGTLSRINAPFRR